LAERGLALAQQRLETLQIAVPLAEEALSTSRALVLKAAHEHLITSYAVSKGVLPSTDPGLRAADAAMWEAKQQLRAAQQRRDALPKQIAQAEADVRTARQQAYVVTHHPELVRALAEAEAVPVPDPDAPQAYTQWTARRQRLETIKAEIASVLAGVSEEG
jgi:hypothetical protein